MSGKSSISTETPPQQKSPWPWSGRKRRDSETSLSSLREFVTGRRSSLSAADAPEVNRLRKKAPDSSSAAKSRASDHEDTKADEKVTAAPAGPGGAKNNVNGKSQSRPPPTFFNTVHHRHTFSASAILRWYTINSDDDSRLKPPSSRPRSSSSGIASSGPKPTAAPPSLRPPRTRSHGPLAMYPAAEGQDSMLRTQQASARIQEVMGSQQAPKDHNMEHAPMIHRPTALSDGPLPGQERPGGFNKPRRLSNSTASSATSSAVSGRDSFDGRMRTVSATSSQTSIDSWPNSPGKNQRAASSPATWSMQNGTAGQHHPWQRPAPIKKRRKAQPGELFAALPGEVLELILEELSKLHLQPWSGSCATCWMRDCCSVAVSARKFLKYAREALYQHIHLVGHEGPGMKKRTKTAHGSRLVLLRRTLRANPQIAAIVRSLKPPARPLSVGVIAYNDLVASVVMACPNFERLVGFYPTYDHSFQRLFQALSTRSKLKEMDWILEPSPSQRQERRPSHNDRWGPVDLQPQESQLFLGFHSNWRQLTTLVVSCEPGAALSPPNLLECTIRSLPSLRNLHLSRVAPATFNNTHLLSMPALRKLSLSYCTGINTAGLSSLATRPTSASLETLTLIHMNVESLPAIARMFSYLTALTNFNLVQTCAPEIPPDEFIMLFPYLASSSLGTLHWDIPYLPNTTTPADAILARSIAAGGFPSLRRLCTPNDPEGLFQKLCAPRERVDQPSDRYRSVPAPLANGVPWGHTRNSSSFSSTRTGSGSGSFKNPFRPGSSSGGFRPGSSSGLRPGSSHGLGLGAGSNSNSNSNHSGTPPVSPLFPPPDALIPRDNSNLLQARLAAQARLEAAQRVPRYFINVVDERGAVVEKHGVGAFLGCVESRIRYVVSPDVRNGGTDESGGLVTVEDMIRDDGGEMVGFFDGGNEKGGKKGRKKGLRERDAESDVEGSGAGGHGKWKTREGCIGRWNTYSGTVVDKKDRERWWHQERGRWRGVVLS
ncbi:hypothetical protein N658DRAFT_494362 [Parathielavia hyrcaniae]|uniref:Uncharacterized protein n=1 Tax=Parathielavia hyrcaniae TaxID=113614 RepID=A0AAN6T3S8_9PEZI|nr:hypothetical protein N658DRAFT_494362 [Parathielavia hyrcaniae]